MQRTITLWKNSEFDDKEVFKDWLRVDNRETYIYKFSYLSRTVKLFSCAKTMQSNMLNS